MTPHRLFAWDGNVHCRLAVDATKLLVEDQSPLYFLGRFEVNASAKYSRRRSDRLRDCRKEGWKVAHKAGGDLFWRFYSGRSCLKIEEERKRLVPSTVSQIR